MIILNCRGFYLRAICLWCCNEWSLHWSFASVYWWSRFGRCNSLGACFLFVFLMQHNICYQQPLLVFKRLMLSTSFHFVPPLQSGIVCLVNFVDVKISVKLPTLFFVLCVLVLHIPSQYPGVSNAVLQNKPKHKLVFNLYCSDRIFNTWQYTVEHIVMQRWMDE